MDEGPPRILHLHSGFNLGGKEARAVRLMNIWGGRAHHTIVSADHTAMGAKAAIAPEVPCDFPMDAAPSLTGWPEPRRYWRWARYMQGSDLVLTYNWGAMDAVMAHRIFSPFIKLPALVHHEDGFNEDEAVKLKWRRNQFRRVALDSVAALVVPSTVLENVASLRWGRGPGQIRRIPNGIDVDRYRASPAPDAIPGFGKRPGEIVIGTLAGLRAVKNLPRMVRAAATLGGKARLVIVGAGPERDAIFAQARALGFEGLVLPGFLPDPWKYAGLFDIFMLSSDSEQFPISLIEAMAAGLPVVATDVGDARNMVAEENAPYIVSRADETALARALSRLIEDGGLRRALGEANRRKAENHYRESDMVAAYAALYGQAMGRPNALMCREN